jgi:hypothetical protein
LDEQSTRRAAEPTWLRDVLVATLCSTLGGLVGAGWTFLPILLSGSFSIVWEHYIVMAAITCMSFILGGIGGALVRTVTGPIHRQRLWECGWSIMGGIGLWVLLLLITLIVRTVGK